MFAAEELLALSAVDWEGNEVTEYSANSWEKMKEGWEKNYTPQTRDSQLTLL